MKRRNHRPNLVSFNAFIPMLVFLLVIVCAFMAATCAPKAGPREVNQERAKEQLPPTVSARVHSQMPVTHYTTKNMDLFCAEAEKRSQGTLKLTHYPAQQLFSDVSVADALPRGEVEIAEINALMFIGRVPTIIGGYLPGMYREFDDYFRVLYDESVGAGLWPKILRKDFEEKANVVAIGSLLFDINSCTITTKPVTSVDGFKGLKIRSYGQTPDLFLQALGASAVTMSSADVYMALQRGTIDGAWSGFSTFVTRKWYEVATHVQNFYAGPSSFTIAVNKDFWNKLAPIQRKALIEAAYVACIKEVEDAMAENAQYRKVLEEKTTIVDFTQSEQERIRTLVRPVMERALKNSLGEDMANKVMAMYDAGLKSKKTWKELFDEDMNRLLSQWVK